MGTCLMCHRKIRDGQKFCDSCKQKRKNKADESYLDSLLSSVGGNQTEEDPSLKKSRQFPAYTDNNSISNGRTPSSRLSQKESAGNGNRTEDLWNNAGNTDSSNYQGNDTNPEMDDMLSDILSDMDEAGIPEQETESGIKEEDIENIFDEAEAYATLLSKEGEGVSIPDEGLVQEASQENPDLIDFEWNEPSENTVPEMEASTEPMPDEGEPGDDTGMDEIILNEALLADVGDTASVQEAFSDFDPLDEELETTGKKRKKKKKKKLSWFKRLFGNVNDDVTPEMLEAEKQKKAKKKEEEKLKKAEKKKQEEERMAEILAEKERKKAEQDAERNRKLALSIEKKNAAKEKQRKKKEQALAIAEYELEHGKINKAGATILFVIFAILTIVIIIGTNIYSYNLSLANAREDFSVRKYNEAYYDVYGYDLKIKESGIEDDILLYDKIMTVMYVKSQLNSYEYYMTSNNREKALDSLLKGLQKYDKYLKLAQELEITSDLDYVKTEILERLKSDFNLDEQDAGDLIAMLDPVDYSEYLYGLIGDYEEEIKKYK